MKRKKNVFPILTSISRRSTSEILKGNKGIVAITSSTLSMIRYVFSGFSKFVYMKIYS